MYAHSIGAGAGVICRVLQGIGVLYLESGVAWWESLLLLGSWIWYSYVMLGAISVLPIDKHREAWDKELAFGRLVGVSRYLVIS